MCLKVWQLRLNLVSYIRNVPIYFNFFNQCILLINLFVVLLFSYFVCNDSIRSHICVQKLKVLTNRFVLLLQLNHALKRSRALPTPPVGPCTPSSVGCDNFPGLGEGRLIGTCRGWWIGSTFTDSTRAPTRQGRWKFIVVKGPMYNSMFTNRHLTTMTFQFLVKKSTSLHNLHLIIQ